MVYLTSLCMSGFVTTTTYSLGSLNIDTIIVEHLNFKALYIYKYFSHRLCGGSMNDTNCLYYRSYYTNLSLYKTTLCSSVHANGMLKSQLFGWVAFG